MISSSKYSELIRSKFFSDFDGFSDYEFVLNKWRIQDCIISMAQTECKIVITLKSPLNKRNKFSSRLHTQPNNTSLGLPC